MLGADEGMPKPSSFSHCVLEDTQAAAAVDVIRASTGARSSTDRRSYGSAQGDELDQRTEHTSGLRTLQKGMKDVNGLDAR
jgi:hypothetical protein